jgi:hypothetical protein
MDFPIIISLLTFVMCLIASLAIYTYLNTREASKVWSRRVEGRAEILDATEDAGLGQSIKREVLELLNSLGKTNQPASASTHHSRISVSTCSCHFSRG